MTKQSRECPNCGKQMVFSGDGRSLVCEQCHHQKKLTHNPDPEKDSPQAILAEMKYRERHFGQRHEDLNRYNAGDPLSNASMVAQTRRDGNLRDLVVRGIAAAKHKEMDEARFYLAKALRNGVSDNLESRAWLWLSETYTDPADKRFCLEQVIAIEPTHPVARRGLAIIDGRLQEADIINPDKLEQEIPDEPIDANAKQFQCPRCAARMNYAPDGKTLRCEFCGYEEDPTAEKLPDDEDRFGEGKYEQEFITALATAKGHLQPVAMRVLQCQSCAVEYTLAPETLSLTCPYCDSVYVTETAETHEIMPPHALIPFATTEDDAKLALRDWFKQHKIERPRVTPIVGVYLPVWTFDIGGEAKWNGMVRNTSMMNSKQNEWVPKSGGRYMYYDDVMIPGSKRAAQMLIKRLDDFDMADLVEYDARYLADWPAERYKLALADASLVARKQVRKDLDRNSFKVTGGESVHSLRISTQHLTIDSFKLILVPLWIAHYKLEGTVYDVTINGQTKKVRGDRPQNVVGKLFSWLKGE